MSKKLIDSILKGLLDTLILVIGGFTGVAFGFMLIDMGLNVLGRQDYFSKLPIDICFCGALLLIGIGLNRDRTEAEEQLAEDQEQSV